MDALHLQARVGKVQSDLERLEKISMERDDKWGKFYRCLKTWLMERAVLFALANRESWKRIQALLELGQRNSSGRYKVLGSVLLELTFTPYHDAVLKMLEQAFAKELWINSRLERLGSSNKDILMHSKRSKSIEAPPARDKEVPLPGAGEVAASEIKIQLTCQFDAAQRSLPCAVAGNESNWHKIRSLVVKSAKAEIMSPRESVDEDDPKIDLIAVSNEEAAAVVQEVAAPPSDLLQLRSRFVTKGGGKTQRHRRPSRRNKGKSDRSRGRRPSGMKDRARPKRGSKGVQMSAVPAEAQAQQSKAPKKKKKKRSKKGSVSPMVRASEDSDTSDTTALEDAECPSPPEPLERSTTAVIKANLQQYLDIVEGGVAGTGKRFFDRVEGMRGFYAVRGMEGVSILSLYRRADPDEQSSGVSLLVGEVPPGGDVRVCMVMFSLTKFTAATAEAWWDEHEERVRALYF
mmetsp:Transcript_4147/g.12090  ORF Transcript_4147/g.12090 Transcript_4147/m.12090 type:complete len:461 (-) Transcript_4147:71-1453(-)|eukprot:CAMPEP_0118881786 /NCGR_PEP_ID=MMETSP1163-20130328/21155_1 /TAXON_ID=124430 /ORGANISM="Phaeomonas parva, Strain CCMP2877" /LENGTH=460 /DNA_ID=CAMNT_0006818651 /DNA_START=77 /DNA_END=1459 /DNA_ORIENTATION=+